MPPYSKDRQQSGKMSTGTKVIIGGGIGCAVIVGLTLIVFGFAGWWFFSPEDQVQTDKILDKETSAVFRLEDISGNHEAMQLISDVLKESQRLHRDQSPSQLPQPIEKLESYFENNQDPGKLVKLFYPKEATISLSSDKAGNTVFTLAANFESGTRMVRTILNAAFENDERLKENKISTEHGDLFLFDMEDDWKEGRSGQNIVGFYKGTFLFSNDRKSAISALDNLAEERSIGKLNEALSDPYYRLSQRGSLAYGVLDGSFFRNPDNDLGIFEGGLSSEIRKAEISLDQLSGENGILNLNIIWNNKQFAARANEEIEKIKSEWIKEAEKKGFDMEVMNSLNNDRIDIQFRTNNLKDSLVELIQNAD